jgi:CHAD domain-containing protein
MREIELKLAAPQGFRMPDLGGLSDEVRAEPAGTARLRATYWDTADLRLIRWGCSLRHRSDEGWTVKLPGEVTNGVLARPEITFGGSARRPPADAVDLVRAFVRNESLRAVTRLRTSRHRVDLIRGSEPVAVVTLDDVGVLDGTRVAHRFRELEVELAGEPPDGLLEAVRGRLAEAGAGEPDPTPKVIRALGRSIGIAPEIPDDRPGAEASVREVIAAAVGGSVRRLVLHDPIARLGRDPEGVHQCRVACRRLRSDLRTFRPHLLVDRTDPVRDELRWLGDLLGAVRDADVLLESLHTTAAGLSADDRAIANRLLAGLEEERTEARASLLAAMREERYVALIDRLVALASDPGVVEADQPAAQALPPLARAPWNRLRKSVRALGASPKEEEFHRVRIRAKRVRYAAEAVAPVGGKQAAAFAKDVAALQDVLGRHQDAAVAERWLRDRGREATARQAFVAGLLAGSIRSERAKAERSFARAWKRARRKGPKTWA